MKYELTLTCNSSLSVWYFNQRKTYRWFILILSHLNRQRPNYVSFNLLVLWTIDLFLNHYKINIKSQRCNGRKFRSHQNLSNYYSHKRVRCFTPRKWIYGCKWNVSKPKTILNQNLKLSLNQKAQKTCLEEKAKTSGWEFLFSAVRWEHLWWTDPLIHS